jgi:hypothetical protein
MGELASLEALLVRVVPVVIGRASGGLPQTLQ